MNEYFGGHVTTRLYIRRSFFRIIRRLLTRVVRRRVTAINEIVRVNYT